MDIDDDKFRSAGRRAFENLVEAGFAEWVPGSYKQQTRLPSAKKPPRRYVMEDLTGQRFGRLTVLRRAPKGKSPGTHWRCRCDCDGKTETVVAAGNLRGGGTKSCGCLKRERLLEARHARTKITSEDVQNILAYLEAGAASPDELAAHYNISCNYLNTLIRHAKLVRDSAGLASSTEAKPIPPAKTVSRGARCAVG